MYYEKEVILDSLTLLIDAHGFHLEETREVTPDTTYRRYQFNGTRAQFTNTATFLAKHGAGLTGQASSSSSPRQFLAARAPLGGASPLHLTLDLEELPVLARLTGGHW